MRFSLSARRNHWPRATLLRAQEGLVSGGLINAAAPEFGTREAASGLSPEVRFQELGRA